MTKSILEKDILQIGVSAAELKLKSEEANLSCLTAISEDDLRRMNHSRNMIRMQRSGTRWQHVTSSCIPSPACISQWGKAGIGSEPSQSSNCPAPKFVSGVPVLATYHDYPGNTPRAFCRPQNGWTKSINKFYSSQDFDESWGVFFFWFQIW